MPEVRLRDITWGGRVRRLWQSQVWKIASKAAVDHSRSYHGNMVTSSETHTLRFLDGGVSDSRGFFDASCGMFIYGKLARAYVLYELGLDATKLLRIKKLPSHRDLQRMVRAKELTSE